MKTFIFYFLIVLLSLNSQAQDPSQAVRNTILKKLDAFKEKSLAITQPSLSFEQVINYQRDLYNMFLNADVLIEAGIRQGNDGKVLHRVYRADELGAWLRSLSRTQTNKLKSIDFQQIELYWISGIEKVNAHKYRLHAWVLPWDKIAYRAGDFRQMPGVREVARELSKERLEAIMASGEELFIGYLKMALLDSPTATNSNMRSAGPQDQTIHTVQPGETLFSIAIKHGVEIGDIMADNSLSSTLIHTGQNLVIGRNQTAEAAAQNSNLPTYLRQGQVHNPYQNSYQNQNQRQYQDSYQTSGNQRSAQAPVEKPLVFLPIYYTIKEYDNARSIAYQFGLSYEQFLEWNARSEFRQGDKVIVDMLAVD